MLNNQQLKKRQAAVAGQFYPLEQYELSAEVDALLTAAQKPLVKNVKALIAPHAGYCYSGPIAANAYAYIVPIKHKIKRVVLLGPAHRVAFKGLALSSATAFQTPLGDVMLDKDALNQLSLFKQVTINDRAHQQEHSLEVHLPFLQRILDDFTLVPLVVGDASVDEVAMVLDALWGGDETLILISSDLSHFLNYQQAQQIDEKTTAAINAFNYEAIGYENACGRNPVNGLLLQAQTKGLKVKTIDVRNSGDTAGSLDRVVGYGAYVFYNPTEDSQNV
ncbi:MAG: AmmeMemoRadiSam system protein B [Gammaproteobacteria bacterium]|nr:AmmeMemoRadiSam system protein B [Gammaproteobacteria bacterium]